MGICGHEGHSACVGVTWHLSFHFCMDSGDKLKSPGLHSNHLVLLSHLVLSLTDFVFCATISHIIMLQNGSLDFALDFEMYP